jgi:hypothetical protein
MKIGATMNICYSTLQPGNVKIAKKKSHSEYLQQTHHNRWIIGVYMKIDCYSVIKYESHVTKFDVGTKKKECRGNIITLDTLSAMNA